MLAAYRPVAIGFGVFLVVSSPVIVPAVGRALPSEIAFVFPYIAAVIAGLVLAHQCSSPSHETKNALLLGIFISLLLGLLNWLGPSDLPGLYYSAWIFMLSLPVTLFLVFAGTGLKGLWGKITHDT
jgi:hypothetical protein